MQPGVSRLSNRLQKLLPAGIILLGIMMRLVVYIKNRCLWTDEVNIALNVIEQPFSGLAGTLNYQQYAPPVYLWATKLFTILFGQGEQALRLYPLLCGIGSLFLLHSILRKNVSLSTLWYPLLIFSMGTFYLRYATEVKQYMPDAFITLALIWLAQRTDITHSKHTRFIWTWLITGSVAIWSSMPSVFVLAGVGCYYGIQSLQQKHYKHLLPIAGISIVWLIQFLAYYFTILHGEITSDYLINYHQQYFLSGVPATQQEWTHDKTLINTLLQTTYGSNTWAIYLNNILLLAGAVYLSVKGKAKVMLYLLPVLLMLTAAALQQYSLIPRLTLFAMPLLLIILAIGLERFIRLRPMITQPAMVIICLVAFISGKPIDALKHPIQEEQITEGLEYLSNQHIPADHIYVYTGAVNSYRYHTTLHPDKDKWRPIKQAHLIPKGANIDSIAAQIHGKIALLYTIPFDSYYTRDVFGQHLPLTNSYAATGCSVYLFEP